MGDETAATAQAPLAGDSEAVDIPPRPKGQSPELTPGPRSGPAPVQEPVTPVSPQELAAAMAGLRCPEAAGPVDARTGLPVVDLLTGLPRRADPRMGTAQDPDDPGSMGWRAYWRAQHAQAEADRPARQREAERLEIEAAAIAAVRRELATAGTGAK